MGYYERWQEIRDHEPGDSCLVPLVTPLIVLAVAFLLWRKR